MLMFRGNVEANLTETKTQANSTKCAKFRTLSKATQDFLCFALESCAVCCHVVPSSALPCH